MYNARDLWKEGRQFRVFVKPTAFNIQIFCSQTSYDLPHWHVLELNLVPRGQFWVLVQPTASVEWSEMIRILAQPAEYVEQKFWLELVEPWESFEWRETTLRVGTTHWCRNQVGTKLVLVQYQTRENVKQGKILSLGTICWICTTKEDDGNADIRCTGYVQWRRTI